MHHFILPLLLTALPIFLTAQQVPDTAFRPEFLHPHYAKGAGPLILIDAAHENFHTLDGRYRAFANVLEADGYRVGSNELAFTRDRLSKGKILVIANALHSRNLNSWQLPTPSAFTADEIAALRRWVAGGGRLLLIADHMPFGGAAQALGETFGFTFFNCFAMDDRRRSLEFFTRRDGTLLSCEIINGTSPEERVDSVVTFTGSAFLAPQEAIPILRLPAHYTILEPTVAWQFPEDTPYRSGTGLLQIAAFQFGDGKIVVSGEAAMFSAQLTGPNRSPVGMNQPEARSNVQLLRNLMRWLEE